MAFHNGPRYGIPTQSGLILALDASNPLSYSGAGNVWYDTSGQNAHGIVTGSVPYTNNGNQSYFNFVTKNDANYIFSTTPQSYFDFTVVIQPDFTLVGGAALAYLIGSSTSGDASFRFGTVNGAPPWSLPNPGNTDDWANSATTYYGNGAVSNSMSYAGWNVVGGTRTNITKFPFNGSFNYYLGTGYPARGFQGKIAALYMYNRALTSAEHIANHAAMKYRFNIP